MEVMGIWLASKIASFVQKEMKLESSRKFIWTDSQISYCWFKKLPKNVFIINRLKDVLESNAELLFVPGKLNPADLGTRGVSIKELKDAEYWWHGPKFLQKSQEYWPKSKDVTQTITTVVAISTSTENTIVLQNVEMIRQYEIETDLSWTNFKIQTAMKLKNVENEDNLTANDLMEAETEIIKQEQQLFITPKLEKELKLAKDEIGIYRIHTRFDHAEMINANPIFLPKDSPISKMIVMDIHEKLHHSGIPHTLSMIREKYWLTAGRLTVKKILQKCKSCKFWKGKSFALPNMPSLPSSRINKSQPFENTGIDYCGPFKIKGDKEKSWIILFTCFTTRLVHLEPVTSMASDQFLSSFRRFVARRGVPQYILTDNAKQFKTAASTLDKIWKDAVIDTKAIQYYNENGITWDFITERAPWKGGLYERLVALVKNAIKQTLGHRALCFIDFWTFLNEVESSINTRPLTYVHSNEAIVIRPVDFILPKVQLALPPSTPDNHSGDPTFMSSNAGGGEYLAERYFATVEYLDKFWKIWCKDYLNLLRERNNDQHKNLCGALQREPILHEIVLVYEPDSPRGLWKKAKIKKLLQSSDGNIRSVEIEYDDGFVTRRAINHLYPLEEPVRSMDLEHNAGGRECRGQRE